MKASGSWMRLAHDGGSYGRVMAGREVLDPLLLRPRWKQISVTKCEQTGRAPLALGLRAIASLGSDPR
jgi:hypothetical protein